MPKCVAGCRLGDTGSPESCADRPLNPLLKKMMTAFNPGSRVPRKARRRKDPLPRPFFSGGRVLSCQCPGEFDARETRRPIPVEDLSCMFELGAKPFLETGRQNRMAVFPPFSVPDQNLSVFEVDVFDS